MEKNIKERLEEVESQLVPKDKKFRFPWKGKIGKGKVKKGYVSIAIINENKEISFTKKPIVDGTVTIDGQTKTIHAVDSKDILTYKSKPFIFQVKGKLNPYNPLKGAHETYGQPYVMARMEGDKLKVKKSMGKIGWIIGIIIAAGIGYSIISGGI